MLRQYHQTQYDKFSKTLNFLSQHLTDKHKIYWAEKYIIPQTFVDINGLLSFNALKLLQPLRDSVHFLHSLF